MFGRKGFFNGLITGGIIGTLAGLFMMPQKKMEKTFMGQGRRAETGAKRMIKGVRKSVKLLVKK